MIPRFSSAASPTSRRGATRSGLSGSCAATPTNPSPTRRRGAPWLDANKGKLYFSDWNGYKFRVRTERDAEIPTKKR